MTGSRRDFIRKAGLALGNGPLACGQNSKGALCLALDPADAVASSGPVRWAAGELLKALTATGVTVRRCERPQQVPAGEFCIAASGGSTLLATAALKANGASAPAMPESLALVNTVIERKPTLVACGADTRGLVYALLELTDRVRIMPVDRALRIDRVVERPANRVRSVMRQFNSELLDKPWFYDREMWPAYLTMLAGHRFNRFHLAFGLGYDDLRQVTDSYLLFLYPFLLAVPGYNVRATNLADSERDRNLETLRFISEQTVARGMDFQLGIWMHGYRWPPSPRAQNTIEGITAENHAAYCRDALTTVLRACPAISSVALRIHGESGIAEGSYDFWKTVFDGVKRCGRKVEIDLHAKGIDSTMIDNALATGMTVNLAPKYWAEHLGMPYHQAAIREVEMPVVGRSGAGLMTLSEGARVATRYGYADLMRDDRKYTIRHRVFSGTQRILLSGDPASTAAYSRMFQFCGSNGADLMEPLTCRGRRGTGVPGTRTGYIDADLEPHWDWEKYAYWYRVWGRMLYSPETRADVFQRQLGESAQATALSSALAQASRILPIVTTAHLPSAACDAYWPEIYWNQPMVGEPQYNPYTDTQAPKTFQHASPLDPQLFSRMNEFAGELLKGEPSGKYSPVEVAQWLEDLADGAEKDLLQAGKPESVELRRLAIDVRMQVGLGRFFAAKFRSGVLYAIHERTRYWGALQAALKAYHAARTGWVQLCEQGKVYAADLSASDKASERGQWADRLKGIDEDIARMEGIPPDARPPGPRVSAAITAALGRPRRDTAPCRHQPPAGFRPRQAVAIELAVDKERELAAPRLYYRHVNQAEHWESVEMALRNGVWWAAIPASYTDSPYPLQYYCELKESPDKAWIYPGFTPERMNLPYFVLRRM